jgi:bifunctional DNA-binding transcriptional regulator/antitoxin component of YhaV-PrlF toxin-antitoxin module
MTYTLAVSKRGTLTLPPELRRRLKLDQVSSPLVIVEERDGGLFLQSAVAMPIRDIPKSTIRQWVLNDEAEAKELKAFRRKK